MVKTVDPDDPKSGRVGTHADSTCGYAMVAAVVSFVVSNHLEFQSPKVGSGQFLASTQGQVKCQMVGDGEGWLMLSSCSSHHSEIHRDPSAALTLFKGTGFLEKMLKVQCRGLTRKWTYVPNQLLSGVYDSISIIICGFV